MLYRFFLAPLTIIFVTLVFLGVTPAVRAQDASIYTVNNVAVDVQGASALDARKQAFAEARRKAYLQVAQSLVSADKRDLVAVPDDKALAAIVRDLEIVQERMTSKRYAGSLNIRFNPTAFKKTIRFVDPAQQGASAQAVTGAPAEVAPKQGGPTPLEPETPRTTSAFEDPETYIYSPAKKGVVRVSGTEMPRAGGSKQADRKAVLVLPWYGPIGRQTIWGEQNPWRDAWEADAKIARDPEMPVVLAVGDVDDLRDYSPPQPLSRRGDVDALMARYNAGRAVLALAEESVDGILFVSLYQYQNGVPIPVGRFNLDASLSKNPMAEAVRKTVSTLRGIPAPDAMSTKVSNLYPSQGTGQAVAIPLQEPDVQTPPAGVMPPSLKALARFSGLQQWVSMRQTLARVPGVTNLNVRAISPSQAQVEFAYAGPADALSHALAQSGLDLQPAPQGAGAGSGSAQYTLAYKKGF